MRLEVQRAEEEPQLGRLGSSAHCESSHTRQPRGLDAERGALWEDEVAADHEDSGRRVLTERSLIAANAFSKYPTTGTACSGSCVVGTGTGTPTRVSEQSVIQQACTGTNTGAWAELCQSWCSGAPAG